QIEGRDATEFLPARGMPEPLRFEPNKEYVRDVLARTCEWAAWDAKFLPVSELPPEHRYFEYQRVVNAGGAPSERVIEERRSKAGEEYRYQSDGPHPLESLSASEGSVFPYAQAVNNSIRGAAE